MLDKPSEVCIMDSDTWGPLRRLRRTDWGRAVDVWPGGAGLRVRGEGQERGERQQGRVKRL